MRFVGAALLFLVTISLADAAPPEVLQGKGKEMIRNQVQSKLMPAIGVAAIPGVGIPAAIVTKMQPLQMLRGKGPIRGGNLIKPR